MTGTPSLSPMISRKVLPPCRKDVRPSPGGGRNPEPGEMRPGFGSAFRPLERPPPEMLELIPVAKPLGVMRPEVTCAWMDGEPANTARVIATKPKCRHRTVIRTSSCSYSKPKHSCRDDRVTTAKHVARRGRSTACSDQTIYFGLAVSSFFVHSLWGKSAFRRLAIWSARSGWPSERNIPDKL